MTHSVGCSFMNTIKQCSLLIIITLVIIINTHAKSNIIKFAHQHQTLILPSLYRYATPSPISSPFHIIAIPIT